jgi:thiol-disulfide isomerase/thioredoxin
VAAGLSRPENTIMKLPLRSRVVLLAACVALAAAPLRAQAPAAPLSPAKGDVIPGFETLGIDGKPVKVDFAKGSKTMLLFFLSGCPTCHKMIPEGNRAFERRDKSLKVVGVIMDQEPPGFWGTMPISFPVIRSPGREFLNGLHVNRAPLTLRVGDGGKVDDVALGLVDPIRLGELFAPPR